jgi:hypothetical protein
MRVVCIDDSNRPHDIPANKWVEKGKEYTIIKFVRMVAQGGILGVELEEIDLSDCFPYECFAASRFAPIEPKKEEETDKVKEIEVEEEELEYA